MKAAWLVIVVSVTVGAIGVNAVGWNEYLGEALNSLVRVPREQEGQISVNDHDVVAAKVEEMESEKVEPASLKLDNDTEVRKFIQEKAANATNSTLSDEVIEQDDTKLGNMQDTFLLNLTRTIDQGERLCVTTYSLTSFTDDNFVKTNESCTLIIKKATSSVCKLNVEFNRFEFPDVDTCRYKALVIGVKRYCGNLTGSIEEVDFDGNMTTVEIENAAAEDERNESAIFYNITVRQIDCGFDTLDGPIPALEVGVQNVTSVVSLRQQFDCNRFYAASEFVIQSPSYPYPYPNSIDCVTTVFPANDNICSLELRFDEFRVEPSSVLDQCANDYLEISDDHSLTDPMRYCGFSTGIRLLEMGELKRFRFHTNSNVTDVGYSILVRQIACEFPEGPLTTSSARPTVPGRTTPTGRPDFITTTKSPFYTTPTSTTYSSSENNPFLTTPRPTFSPTSLSTSRPSFCSKTFLASPPVRISSPNYPNIYLDNDNCLFYVQFTRNDICFLQISFIFFDVELSDNCNKDFLLVNGNRLCGEQRGTLFFPVFQSSTVELLFSTDSSGRAPGFEIEVSQVQCDSSTTGKPTFAPPQATETSRPPFQSSYSRPSYEVTRTPPYELTRPPYETTWPLFQTNRPPFQTNRPPYQTYQPTYQTTRPPYQTTAPTYQPTRPPYEVTRPPYETSRPPYYHPTIPNYHVTNPSYHPTSSTPRPPYNPTVPIYYTTKPPFDPYPPIYYDTEPSYGLTTGYTTQPPFQPSQPSQPAYDHAKPSYTPSHPSPTYYNHPQYQPLPQRPVKPYQVHRRPRPLQSFFDAKKRFVSGIFSVFKKPQKIRQSHNKPGYGVPYSRTNYYGIQRLALDVQPSVNHHHASVSQELISTDKQPVHSNKLVSSESDLLLPDSPSLANLSSLAFTATSGQKQPLSNKCDFETRASIDFSLISPNYPSHYNDNINCIYQVLPLPNVCGLRLFLIDFILEESASCYDDYLDLQGSRFCGQQSGREIFLPLKGNSWNLLLHTDSRGNCRGFNIKGKQISCQDEIGLELQGSPEQHVIAGDDLPISNTPSTCHVTLFDNQGSISSKAIGSNQTCDYEIVKATGACKINFVMKGLSFGSPCHDSHVKINSIPFCHDEEVTSLHDVEYGSDSQTIIVHLVGIKQLKPEIWSIDYDQVECNHNASP